MQIHNISVNDIAYVKPVAGQEPQFYKEGQEVAGEIIDVSDNKVTLRLADGTQLHAMLKTNMRLVVGDQLTLVVANSNPGQVAGQGVGHVTLKLNTVNGQEIQPNANPLENLLLQSGAGYSAQRMELAQILQELRLPISSNVLSTIEQALASFSALSPKLAAFMAAQGVPITQENIQILTDWLSGNQQLPNLLEGLTALQTPATAPGESNQTLPAQTTLLPTPPNVLIAQEAPQSANAQPFAAPAEGSASVPQNPQPSAASTPQSFVSAFMEKLSASVAQSVQASPQMQDGLNALLTATPQNLNQSATALLQAIPQTFSPAARSDILFSLVQTLQELPYDPSLRAQPQAEAVAQTANDSAQNTQQLIQTLGEQASKLFGKISQSDANMQNLQKAVKALPEFLATLKQSAEPGQPLTQLSASATQLLSQAKMGGEFTNFLYAQIPFTAHEQKNSAHLYVMKRNANATKIDRENVTMLLSLMTQNLGQVDSVVRIEKNVMQLQLRVESIQSKKALEAGLPTLKTLMKQTPYLLSAVNVSIADEKVSPVTAVAIASQAKNQLSSGLDIIV